MNLSYTFVVFVVLSLSPSFLLAQRDFRKGYYINLQRDTIVGFIQNSPSQRQKGICHFKSHKKSKAETFTLTDIIGFGFVNEDRYFEKLIVPSNNPSGYPKYAFAEMLLSGKYNLFLYKSDFYAQRDSLIVKIENKEEKVIETRHGKFIQKKKLYPGILRQIMDDCLPAKSKDSINYTKRDFLALFKAYSECSHSNFHVYKKSLPWSKFNFTLYSGVLFSNLHYLIKDIDFFNPTYSFIGGGGIEINSPRFNEKLHILLDANFNHTRFKGYDETQLYVTINKRDYTVDLKSIKVPIGIKMNLSGENLTPFFKIGFTKLIPLKATWEMVSQTITSYDITTEVVNRNIQKKTSPIFWAGIGFQWKILPQTKMYFDFRIERYSDYIEFYNNTYNISVFHQSSVMNKIFTTGIIF